MPANPRDPAFEEAVHTAVQTIATGYPWRPLHEVQADVLAAYDAAVTRAVRDTREECARVLERKILRDHLGREVTVGPNNGWVHWNNSKYESLAAEIRALNPTPERLYTEAEVIERERAAWVQGVKHYDERITESDETFLPLVAAEVYRVPATPAPETSHERI